MWPHWPCTRYLVELLFFGRAGQRGHGRGAALDHGGHVVEVAAAHFLLVRHKGVTLGGVSELLLLQLHVGGSFSLTSPTRDIAVPITLPGDVHSALLAADIIPDPYFGENEMVAMQSTSASVRVR